MSRSRVRHRPAVTRKRALLVPAGLAFLLPLGACIASNLPADRGVEIRVSHLGPQDPADPAAPDLPPEAESIPPQEEEVAPAETDETALETTETEALDEPAEEESTESAGYDAPETTEKGTTVTGYVSGRSRSRWNDDEDDHDLYAVAHTEITTAGENPWKVQVTGRGSWDVDGASDDSTFFDIEDTYDGDVQGRLYRASVDAPLGHGVALARFGRQILWESPVTIHFDGIRLETEAMGLPQLVVGAYGGIPVHQYESSSSGDELVGAYAKFHPWERGGVRVDWMHIGDEMRFTDEDNDLLALSLRHRFEAGLEVEGDYSRLEDENRDAAFRAHWFLPDSGLTMRFSHYRLLEAQTDLVQELNPFFYALGTFYPYDQTQFQASKTFGERYELFGGLDFRRVDEEEEIGRYNRDWDRYYLTAAMAEFLHESVVLSFTGEVWDSPGQDFSTWGIDLSGEFTEQLRGAVGSYFSLFKYYLDTERERENVRTYYAELRRTLSKATALTVRYEFEDEELDEYHTLRVGMTWRF